MWEQYEQLNPVELPLREKMEVCDFQVFTLQTNW